MANDKKTTEKEVKATTTTANNAKVDSNKEVEKSSEGLKKEPTEKAKKVAKALALVKAKANYTEAPFPEVKNKTLSVTVKEEIMKDGVSVLDKDGNKQYENKIKELTGKDAQHKSYERKYNSLSSKIVKVEDEKVHDKAIEVLKPFFELAKEKDGGKKQYASTYEILEKIASIYKVEGAPGKKKITADEVVNFDF